MSRKCRLDSEGFCPTHGWDCADFQIHLAQHNEQAETQPIVLVPVMYRDADNYKETSVLAFLGRTDGSLQTRLVAALNDGEDYLPTQIGHEHLGARMQSWPDPDSDHVWQTICIDDIEQIQGDPNDHAVEEISFAEFVELIENQKATGWNVVAACAELHLEGM